MSGFPEVEGRINEIFKSPIATKMLKAAIDRGDASGLANVIMTYIVEWDGEETAFEASEALNTQPIPNTFTLLKADGVWYSGYDALCGRVDRSAAECEVVVTVQTVPVRPFVYQATTAVAVGYGPTVADAVEDAQMVMLNLLNVKAPKGQDFRWLTQGRGETIFSERV